MLIIEERKLREEFNKEPVYYCKHCLSLRILNAAGQDFCDYCGSDDIGTASIEEWEDMCIKRFGRKLYK